MKNPSPQSPLFPYLLRLADNALIAGQRLSEWVGHAPQLEEELAFANFALDYLGQARALYSYAGEVEGAGRDEDALAYLRDSQDFYNLLLLEQPNGDFAQTIVRQFFFEAFYRLQLEALLSSRDARLAAIAARAAKELAYHLRHTRAWVLRLGDGTDESHRRAQTAVDKLWQYTGEMFVSDEIDERVAEAHIGPRSETLFDPWQAEIQQTFEHAGLSVPDSEWMASGGKQGRHGEHHGYLLAEMQFLQRAYPDSRW